MLPKATATLHSSKPLENIWESFCGIHPCCDNINRQIVSYHYCYMLDEDRRNCLVYDSNEPKAKLIAVKYIISEKLFKELPTEEKKLWHSHKYEVESGMLAMTAKLMVPKTLLEKAENKQLAIIANTYGKTWKLWLVDKDSKCSSGVIYCPPRLLMSFTQDGRVNPNLVKERDEYLNITTEQKRKTRAGVIKPNPVLHGADHWEHKTPW